MGKQERKDKPTHRPSASDGCTFISNRFLATENIVVAVTVFLAINVVVVIIAVAVCLPLPKLELPSLVK